MSEATPDSSEVSSFWILLFLLLALGAGAAAVLFTGGSLLAGGFVGFPGGI